MKIFELTISNRKLTDVQKRSFYLSVTLFEFTAWCQYWPRPIAGKKLFTYGARK
jgi:hypothetical protein